MRVWLREGLSFVTNADPDFIFLGKKTRAGPWRGSEVEKEGVSLSRKAHPRVGKGK